MSSLTPPVPSTSNQLYQPDDFGSHRTGLSGILTDWSVPVFIEVGPGLSWQARACLFAVVPLRPFLVCKLKLFTSLELLLVPEEHGTGSE